uniref:Flavoprotein domain-containing protein n=1 Tax=Monopterus albus TaxID=43700 RepID=A0A3Q3J067_MONAL
MQTEHYVSCGKTDLPKSCGEFRVLVGVTGSVAALKLPLLVSQLLHLPGVDVRVVTTENAKHFYNPEEVSVNIYSDKDEWELWTQRSDPVLHIELRRWADLLVIAPLDANTLGKIASGICDNLLVRTLNYYNLLLFIMCHRLLWQIILIYCMISLKLFTSLSVAYLLLADVCGKSLGYQPTRPLLPCDEYSYVAASHYSPTGIQAERVWICGNPLHCQEAGVWR